MSVAVADAGGMDLGCCCGGRNVYVSCFKYFWFFPPWTASEFSTVTTHYRTATFSAHWDYGGGNYKDPVVTLSFDRLNGQPTITMNDDAAEFGWPGADVSRPWSVAATLLSYSESLGTISIELSDPYTIEELNADLDTMRDTVNPKLAAAFEGADWTLVEVRYNDFEAPFWDLPNYHFPGPAEIADMIAAAHPAPALVTNEQAWYYSGPANCQQDRRYFGIGVKLTTFWRGLGGTHCAETTWSPAVISPSCATLTADGDGDVFVEPPDLPTVAVEADGTLVGTRDLVQFHHASAGETCPCEPN